MKIVIDADASGHALKVQMSRFLEVCGYDVTVLVGNTDDQYPEIGRGLAKHIAKGRFDRGILICETGQGMALAANKVRGVYACVCPDPETAENCAGRKGAQVLCLGCGSMDFNRAALIAQAFMLTKFDKTNANARRLRALEKSL